MSVIKRWRESRETLSAEYQKVNSNPFLKYGIQAVVMVVDLMIMLVLIWNMFAYFIPIGSWINVVDGNSMWPTMNSGQIIYSDTDGSIERGDVVTSYVPDHALDRYPSAEGVVLVKRVVGMPGDRLIINADGVYINGEKLVEDYLTEEAIASTYKEGNCNSVQLGAGEYFLMGDNRGNSSDSRIFGVMSREDILYKQSAEPTKNFYLKLTFVILVFLMDICMYALIEFVLTESVYWILFGRKVKENADNVNETTDDVDDNQNNNVSNLNV